MPKNVHFMIFFLSIMLYLILSIILSEYIIEFSNNVWLGSIIIVNIVLTIIYLLQYKLVDHFLDKSIYEWMGKKSNDPKHRVTQTNL